MTRTPEQSHRAFREFEHMGWEEIPAAYDEGFAGLTSQAAQPLLDVAGVVEGTHVLDVATGPGYVAAAAADRGAEVMGIDFSARMVEQARSRHPNVAFREGDAEALPFPDAEFDAVVMNFGLLHLARPGEALREAYRVLRSGGRYAFTVWAPPEEAVGFGMVLRAVEAYGRLDVPIPPGPPFFRFSDSGECVRIFEAAGFADVCVTHIPQVWRLPSPDALFDIMHSGTVRTAGLLRAQPARVLESIRAAMRDDVGRYRENDGFDLPMPAVLACALKP